MTNDGYQALLDQTTGGGLSQPLRVSGALVSKLAQDDKASVMSALQDAIELEHSTIPPYLYALYTLDASKNGAVAEIIESIVVEEMLHMTLACNILIALGGRPQIDKPSFIPSYPGTLPGIEPPPGWQVALAPCSTQVIQQVFMQIELPEYTPPDYPVQAANLQAAQGEPATIGQFYQQLAEQIRNLPVDAFDASGRDQVGPDLMREAVIVTDAETACAAIGLIIDQGEGTDPKPFAGPDPFDAQGQPAHYYRFAEIIKGRRLVPITGETLNYAYAGAPVVFDTGGVWEVAPDYAEVYQATRTFNYTYTNLLKTLHRLFNGQNTRPQFSAALGLMMSLKQQATDMIAVRGIGPSFRYRVVNG